MIVQELIEALQQLPKDLEVYAYTDHGQTPEGICSPQVAWFDDELDSFTTDTEVAEEYGCTIKGIIL